MTPSVDPTAEPQVRHDALRSRYELVVHGAVVSRAEYEDDGGVRAFTHTRTEPADRGNGYAAIVVEAALDDTRVAGLTVVPACWFVRDFIAANARYQDLLAS